MTTRIITTLQDGNVLVLTGVDGVPGLARREYCRRGQMVYQVQDVGPKLPMSTTLRAGGTPLQMGAGEALEQTIRRALDERDGKAKPTLADRLEVFERVVMWVVFVVAVAVGLIGMVVEIFTQSLPIG